MSSRIFAIGDVHGCVVELRLLLNSLPLRRGDTVVFLGDYVDRGRHSREVIDTIIDFRSNHRVVTLMGNHEQLFMAFLENPKSHGGGEFILNGGSSTLASYADDSGNFEIPSNHRRFLRELELFYQTDDYFMVHAGVPDIPLEQIDPELHASDLLWLRREFLGSSYRWSKTIVHGHTPRTHVELLPHRINVDTGCAYGRALSAVELPARQVHSVERCEDEHRVYLKDKASRRAAVRFEGALPVQVNEAPPDASFETVNYSEIGLLIRQLEPRTGPPVVGAHRISGIIGGRREAQVRFSGEILRSTTAQDAIYYAIEILDSGPAHH